MPTTAQRDRGNKSAPREVRMSAAATTTAIKRKGLTYKSILKRGHARSTSDDVPQNSLRTGAKPALRRPTDGPGPGPGRDLPGNCHPSACSVAVPVDGDPQPTNSHVNHHQPSSQASGFYVGCLRGSGDKSNDHKMPSMGVYGGAVGVENDEGVDHDVGGGRGPEFEFPTAAPRPDELTLSLPRKPRTDFGAETGHVADTHTSPEQVPISISPSEQRHGGGNGDQVEGRFGALTHPNTQQLRDMYDVLRP
ncbi:hypothetical protein THAOC_12762 [Thalassiosira oceanica]|uniref:Uncharacterized protein n=1 Tax=Thalassiosira oceanica TaxID=159749 RepID=K0SZ65_THAOC|nr:hypothetical protein THAOC_12762 [Thalassiosira oceanica]|eukprot:EJK66326.1 hypothetical protein THAOC_12762 [Thalassiosira oceanica]